MAVDYGAKEREFIAGLKGDTGRDLAEWMTAIDGARLGHRNDIIDWLRQKGFLFAKASWLERIHHNGGRPIYGEGAASRLGVAIRRMTLGEGPAETPAQPAAPIPVSDTPVAGKLAAPAPAPATHLPVVERPLADRPPPVAAVADADTVVAVAAAARAVEAATTAPNGELGTLLATAKAYRPLAQLLLREVEKCCPGAVADVHDGYVVVSGPHAFAVVTLSPRDIRLGLDLGGWPFAAPLQRARLSGPPARYGHMAVLTDARQVDAALMAYVRAARDRAKS